MKALLVDPDSQRAPVLAQALGAAGMEVSIAASGSFALTMLEWNKQDVIISRARLDDMEGHELCAIVRSDPSTKEVRFVLVVGPGENAPRQTAAAGVDLLLPDALSNATLVTRVIQLVRRQEDTTPAVSAPPPPPAVIMSPPAVAPLPTPAAPPRIIAPPPATPPPPPSPPRIAPPPPPPRPTTPPPQWSIPPIVRPTLAPAPSAARPTQPAPAATSPAPAPAAPTMAGLDTVGTHSGARTFQGALGVLEIEELTQAIAVGGKTGRLLLVLNSGGGLIVFEDGRVTHAEYGGQAGEPAFSALVAASHREPGGKFCFIPVQQNELRTQPKTIVRGVDQLLLDVARAMDEEKRA